LRTKLLVAGTVAAIAMLLLAIVVASSVFIRRFDAIEVTQTHEKADQALRALQSDLNQLAISTRDYAEWDDAAEYVHTRAAEFVHANFSYDSLDGMEVDAAVIFGADGTPIFAGYVNHEAHELEWVPADLLKALDGIRTQHEALRKLDSIARLVHTPRGMLAFSAIEIRRSDKSAPSGAVMVFARLLRSDEIERVRETSQLPARFVWLDANPALPNGVRTWLTAGSSQVLTFVHEDDHEHVTGFAMLRDVARKPVGVLAVTIGREVGLLGRRTTTALLGTIGGLIAVCGAALLILMLNLRRSWAARAMLETRHRKILRHLDETIVLADPATGHFIDVNEALLRVLDYATTDLPHLNLRHVYVDLPDPLPVPAVLGEPSLFECRMRARDGRLIDAEVTFTRVIDEGKELLCVVGRDLSLRKQAEARLRESESRLARVVENCELTGLPNRAALQQRLPQLLENAAMRREAIALYYIDVDHFKNVNDSRGHAFGDRVLQLIATRLQQLLGADVVLARMGGDEFVAVGTQTQAATVRSIANGILAEMTRAFDVDDASFTMSASVGIAVYPEDGLDAESLLKHADIALYEAKAAGRNAYRQFSAAMNVQLSENVALEQALRRALNTEQIYVEYQPVVDLQTGLLVSFEALARWKHPELGQVSPARFIPVAEKSGLIVQLGEHIVREVVGQLSRWRGEGVPLAPVAVNVAPMQFERTSFSTFVHELLMLHDLEPSWLSFEITESALLKDSNAHVVMIDTLRHAGSRVYIDDFGTGFSNFAYLKTLPADALKIDQSFIRGMGTDENDAAIVSGIVSMASKLKLATIAEGVETAEIVEKLRAMGCNYGQGYYFSKPMPATHCRALLEQLGETRRFTETVKIRAFAVLKSA
jgi:diguanylate cyclase (GGDEF)-like protein/PAS domain S-box-containing protein